MDRTQIDSTTKATGKRRRVKIRGNLHINVTPKGARSWVLFRRASGKVKEIGLGRYPDASYEAAMVRAQSPDPPAARSKPAMPTFGDGFRAVLEKQPQDWDAQNDWAQIYDWQRAMERHAARLMDMPIDAITPQDVAAVLDGAISSRTGKRSDVLAARLRKRIELVFSWATAQRPTLRTDNPALADVQRFVGRRIKLKHVSHAACPHERVGELLAVLGDGVTGEAVRFTTMTGVRVRHRP